MRFDGIGKLIKLGHLMIMADGLSGRFPDMLYGMNFSTSEVMHLAQNRPLLHKTDGCNIVHFSL